MNDAQRLGSWVLANAKTPITHLKLQKLCFYCFGAALAIDAENEVGTEIIFEPWTHGPVLRDVYDEHRHSGSVPLAAKPFTGVPYSAKVEKQLLSALRIYERLSAWDLREESHDEAPWQKAYEAKLSEIDPVQLKQHFVSKFGGRVRIPDRLLLRGSYELDGAANVDFGSLSELADALGS